MVGMVALDKQVLNRCPAAERGFAFGIAIVALCNGILIFLAALCALRIVGQPYDVSSVVGGLSGFWYLTLQHVLLQLHGEHRTRLATGVSKFFCLLFLGFFACMVSLSLLSAGANLFELYLNRFTAQLVVAIVALAFLFPLYARVLLVQRGMYGQICDREIEAAVKEWDRHFVKSYVSFVEHRLGLVGYQIPAPMIAAEALMRDRERRNPTSRH